MMISSYLWQERWSVGNSSEVRVCVCVFERSNLQQAAEESDIYFQFTAVCQKKRNVIVCNNNNRKPVSVCLKWNVFLLQEHVKDILADTVEKTIQTAC